MRIFLLLPNNIAEQTLNVKEGSFSLAEWVFFVGLSEMLKSVSCYIRKFRCGVIPVWIFSFFLFVCPCCVCVSLYEAHWFRDSHFFFESVYNRAGY